MLHVSGRELSKNNQAQRHDPADDHGICDWESEDTSNLDGILREAMLHRFTAGLRLASLPGITLTSHSSAGWS
jgi:hypothetical protein